MVELINRFWGWTGARATDIISINVFGNIIFKADDGAFWQLCPEALSCAVIAGDRQALNDLMATEDFSEAWEMWEVTETARTALGDLDRGEKYCLKLPLILGGLYEPSNLGKILHDQLIAFSGEMAFRIKDLPDGEKFRSVLD